MSSSRREAVDGRSDGGGDDDVGSQDDEQYPPWLADVARECPYTCTVLEEQTEKHCSGYIRCKRVELPDATDCAHGKAPRKYNLQRYSTVLVLAGPDEPPYIGLVDKIWRKAAAVPAGGRVGTYQAVDFQVECYWFYRRSELPSVAWTALRRTSNMPGSIRGARYANSSKERQVVETDSPRQVLFSSHHTQHDVDAAGPPGINMSAVLQTCEVHWLGPRAAPPDRYTVHRSRLICTREPGFVVQGFLWCNSRGKAQFAAQYKRAFPLDGSWNDVETANIVEVMCNNYQRKAASLTERNRRVIDRYRQHTLIQQQDVISSDDGEVAQPLTTQQRHGKGQPAAALQAHQSQQQRRNASEKEKKKNALVHELKSLGHCLHVAQQQKKKQQQQQEDSRMKLGPASVEAESSSDSDDNIALVQRMRGINRPLLAAKQQPSRWRQQQPCQDLHHHDDHQQKQAMT